MHPNSSECLKPAPQNPDSFNIGHANKLLDSDRNDIHHVTNWVRGYDQPPGFSIVECLNYVMFVGHRCVSGIFANHSMLRESILPLSLIWVDDGAFRVKEMLEVPLLR